MIGYKDSIPSCLCVKTRSDAIIPSKSRATDEGYDLTLISVDKVISKMTTRYDTGIKTQPPPGYHLELLPRSSLSNSGYILANSVGLIDCPFRGSLKVVLTKIDPDMPDLTLPFKCMQMVLRKNIHFLVDEVTEIDDTARGSGGFGSTTA
jgi:dUTP pyrophosphatase